MPLTVRRCGTERCWGSWSPDASDCIGFDYSLHTSTTPQATVVERGVALIVAMVVLVAVRVQQTMRRNTQMILRAIAKSGRKA